jgi:Rrf2 family nitric oxide-sensitive transcriptional repressor
MQSRMRLTSFTDFGLRALMRMASAPGRGFSSTELADEFGISRNHLIKILAKLARGGFVETRRGGGGGATLARPPAQIRIGDIVRLLEEGQALVECFVPGGGDCSIDGCCRLKARLRSAEAAFLADLDRSTLADIALPRAIPALPAAE